MDKLKHIKCDLEEMLYKVLEENEENHYKNLDIIEFGAVVDILKDLSQAIYYDTVNERTTKSGTDSHTQM